MTIKKVHFQEEATVIIKIVITRGEGPSIIEETEVVVIPRETHTKSLIIKIKITKLMKKMLRKVKRREKHIKEAEDLIKRMVNMFREEVEEETSEVLTEEEERTKVNTKDIMKIVEATIIIKKTGKEVELVIRNNRKK